VVLPQASAFNAVLARGSSVCAEKKMASETPISLRRIGGRIEHAHLIRAANLERRGSVSVADTEVAFPGAKIAAHENLHRNRRVGISGRHERSPGYIPILVIAAQ